MDEKYEGSSQVPKEDLLNRALSRPFVAGDYGAKCDETKVDDLKIEEEAVDIEYGNGRIYSYEEYHEIDDGKRYELIDGMLYMLAAPLVKHEDIKGYLFNLLYDFLKGKPCKVYSSGLEVCFSKDKIKGNAFLPDIVVVCDKSKFDEIGCYGAPDFIIEILSPSNRSHDLITKFNKYLKAGVREYWTIDPEKRTVSVNLLKNGQYVKTTYSDNDIVPVSILNGFKIDMNDVFPK